MAALHREPPGIVHDLEGPILPGEWFMWEPLKSHARALVHVTHVVEGMIRTQGWDISDGTFPKLPPASPQWNDEDRFREASVRIPIRTVP